VLPPHRVDLAPQAAGPLEGPSLVLVQLRAAHTGDGARDTRSGADISQSLG
jgi:hypothetical protein